MTDNDIIKVLLLIFFCIAECVFLIWIYKRAGKKEIEYFENRNKRLRELAVAKENIEDIGKIEDKRNIISLDEMIKMYDKEFSETSFIARQNLIYLKELKCRRYEVEYYRLQTIRFASLYVNKIPDALNLNPLQIDIAEHCARETLKDVGIMDVDSSFTNPEGVKI